MMRALVRTCPGALLVLAAAACGSTETRRASGAAIPAGPLPIGAEARAVDGTALYPPPLSSEDFARRSAQYADALAGWELEPRSAEATIWLGRRLGYLGRFREAIETLSIGIAEHPDDPRLYRHRGHRWITVRDFDRAAADLERAAELVETRADEIEPDGQPNARGVPLETLKSNVYYHLALARFLRGEFEEAAPVWRRCLEVSRNADTRCSATHWLASTLRRLGRDDEAREVLAPIRADLEVVEYHGYHQLCLAYKGERDPDDVLARARERGADGIEFASVGFGVAHWHLCEGHADRAKAIFQEVAASPQWHSFGRIASEVELARAHGMSSASFSRFAAGAARTSSFSKSANR
jgi:tetratricopeptide (TPR) repeat protein